MDRHDRHHSTEFELFWKDHKIITLCVSVHSSYILQPLDVDRFGDLEMAYGREIEGLMRGRITHITKADFIPSFCGVPYVQKNPLWREANLLGWTTCTDNGISRAMEFGAK